MAKRAKIETRADANGVKPGVLRRKTVTTLARIRRDVEALTVAWDDVSSGYVADLEEMYRYLDQLEEELKGQMEYLAEPWADGWGDQ